RADQRERIARGQLGAEVEALLLVRLAGGQLIADAEVAPPGPAPQGHADRELRLQGLCEELPAEVAEPTLQRRIHAVPDDVEEPALSACPAERLGRGPPGGAPRHRPAHD